MNTTIISPSFALSFQIVWRLTGRAVIDLIMIALRLAQLIDVMISMFAVDLIMRSAFVSIRSLLLPFWISSSESGSFAVKIIKSTLYKQIKLLIALS